PISNHFTITSTPEARSGSTAEAQQGLTLPAEASIQAPVAREKLGSCCWSREIPLYCTRNVAPDRELQPHPLSIVRVVDFGQGCPTNVSVLAPKPPSVASCYRASAAVPVVYHQMQRKTEVSSKF